MHSRQKTDSTPSHDMNDPKAGEIPSCGIVMPISATALHGADHWSDVQKLLHRVVVEAGFVPRNVWMNEASDSITPRLISNIFECDISLVDISDQNPNVMFELGLRLASKKPTIVVSHKGSPIPFDISDFEVLDYPESLNILGMETFFIKVARSLKAKHAAYLDGKYKAFLEQFHVDVLQPQTRPVGVEELMLSRIDEVIGRLQRFERSAYAATASNNAERNKSIKTRFKIKISGVDDRNLIKFYQQLEKYFPGQMVTSSGDDGNSVVIAMDARNHQSLDQLTSLIVATAVSCEIDPSKGHLEFEY